MATKKIRLHKLEKEIHSLRDNHSILLKAARIGKFRYNQAHDINDSEQPQELATPLDKKHHFQEVYDQTERQQFISQTSANQIVQSAHNLIELINELKTAYIINDTT
eukprot:433139_1